MNKIFIAGLISLALLGKTNEQIADDVIAGYWGNGVQRQEMLTLGSANYAEIQDIVNKKLLKEEPKKVEKTVKEVAKKDSSSSLTVSYLKYHGVVKRGGKVYTWYSSKVLPGKALKIPGRHTSGGFVRDKDGYICVANDVLKKGTVVSTPWGMAKVYDRFGENKPANYFDMYTE